MDTENTRQEEGQYLTDTTLFGWPLRVTISWPVTRFHILQVRSGRGEKVRRITISPLVSPTICQTVIKSLPPLTLLNKITKHRRNICWNATVTVYWHNFSLIGLQLERNQFQLISSVKCISKETLQRCRFSDVFTFRSSEEQLICSIHTQHWLWVALGYRNTLQGCSSTPLHTPDGTDHTPTVHKHTESVRVVPKSINQQDLGLQGTGWPQTCIFFVDYTEAIQTHTLLTESARINYSLEELCTQLCFHHFRRRGLHPTT